VGLTGDCDETGLCCDQQRPDIGEGHDKIG